MSLSKSVLEGHDNAQLQGALFTMCKQRPRHLKRSLTLRNILESHMGRFTLLTALDFPGTVMLLSRVAYQVVNKLRHLHTPDQPACPPAPETRDGNLAQKNSTSSTDISESAITMSGQRKGDMIEEGEEACKETNPQPSEAGSRQSAAETEVSAWGYTIRTLESSEPDPDASSQDDSQDFAERVYGNERSQGRLSPDPAPSISTSELISEMREGPLLSHLLRVYEICHPSNGKLADLDLNVDESKDGAPKQPPPDTLDRGVSNEWESFSMEQTRLNSHDHIEHGQNSVTKDDPRNDSGHHGRRIGRGQAPNVMNWVDDQPDQSQSNSREHAIQPRGLRRVRRMSNIWRAARETI